jgi:hypothetical protein
MKQKADILNWAMLFSAISLTAAFLGARQWSAMCVAAQHEPSGSNIFSGVLALACMFHAGLVSFIVSGIYSLIVKRSDAILGFAIAAMCALPLMMANSILVYFLWFILDFMGLKNPPFNPYDLRLILPVTLTILSFLHKPRSKQPATNSNQDAHV